RIYSDPARHNVRKRITEKGDVTPVDAWKCPLWVDVASKEVRVKNSALLFGQEVTRDRVVVSII
ncbi:MAG: hypothetical protein WCD30_15050, partial [Pseudolabrys sp.]